MKREALLKKSKKGGETGAGLPNLREEKGGGLSYKNTCAVKLLTNLQEDFDTRPFNAYRLCN